MPRGSAQSKPYVSYIGGLWTESTPLSYPENTVSETYNFKYNPDGSIERRLGLEPHEDIVETLEHCDVVESHRWKDPSNSVSLEIIAVQSGSSVCLYSEDKDCRSEYSLLCCINLEDYRVNSESIHDYPVDFESGGGKLFIAHKAIQPIYITYNDGLDECSDDPEGCNVKVVDLYERDLEGVDDGLSDDECPEELTPEHLYNLYNQGWTDEYIQLYYQQSQQLCQDQSTTTQCEWVNTDPTDPTQLEWVCSTIPSSQSCTGCYPANNEQWQMGLYIDPNDGLEKWSLEELRKSSIGSANVSSGRFIRNVFDTCDVFDNFSSGQIESAELDPDCIIIRFTQPHGFVPGDTYQVVGSVVVIEDSTGNQTFSSYDGTYTIGTDSTIIDDYSVKIDLTIIGANLGDTIRITNSGTLVDSIQPKLPDCCVTSARPESVGLYAGRVWYAGIHSPRLGNRVYFSQVLTDDSKIGRMYQNNDPTSQDFSELLRNDGGFIEIPELGRVHGLQTMKDALLVMSDNGIWAITGGTYEYFAATSYSVSKLTEVGVIAKKSIEEAEDTWVYAANRGIYLISPDNRVTNITQEAIHDRYRQISNKEEIDIVYNPYEKTLHVLHDLDSDDECWRYCSELILNHRIKAWYEYRYFTYKIAHAFITGNDSSEVYDQVYLADISDMLIQHYMSDCNFEDWLDNVDAKAYLRTAPELLGDLSTDKKVYELSFYVRGEIGSQAKFRGLWDWACQECENKWTDIKDVVKNEHMCDGKVSRSVTRTDYKSLKGSGRAFEYEFASVEKRPITIYGWNALYEPKS